MNSVDSITDEIKRHEEAIKALREKLKNLVNSRMTSALDSASAKQDVEVLSEHPRIVVVKSSNLIGNPWNINFQDWASGAKCLIKYFEDKKLPPEKWYETLKELYDNRKEFNRVDLSYKERVWFNSYTTRKEPISAEFVKLVLEEMEK